MDPGEGRPTAASGGMRAAGKAKGGMKGGRPSSKRPSSKEGKEQQLDEDGRPPLKFKLGKEVTNAVRIFLKARGWVEHAWTPTDDTSNGNGAWNLFWQDKLYDANCHRNARPDQRMNHFQNTRSICRKDMLAMNMRKMRALHGPVYDFLPTCYLLPKDKQEFLRAHTKGKKADQARSPDQRQNLWIFKPSASARGKGIFVFSELETLWASQKLPCVVQRYIPRPLLIEGYKFDLRLYCLVPSFWPLRVLLHKKGLVRFSTHRYSNDDLSNKYIHLTNSSINKSQLKGMGAMDAGSERVLGRSAKWTLDELWVELRGRGYNTSKIWEDIKRICLLTLLPLVGEVPHDRHAYELLGFDVMFDDAGRSWLIEVNRSPAMAVHTPCDKLVKTDVVSDMFNIVGLDKASILAGGLQPDGVPRELGGFDAVFPFNTETEQACARLVADSGGCSPSPTARRPGGAAFALSAAGDTVVRRPSSSSSSSSSSEALFIPSGQPASSSAAAAAAAGDPQLDRGAVLKMKAAVKVFHKTVAAAVTTQVQECKDAFGLADDHDDHDHDHHDDDDHGNDDA